MPNSSRKRKAASLKKNNKNNKRKRPQFRNDGDFISQLEALREFVHGCSQAYTENDLSICLRECNYNVQIAGERLIMGQFRSSSTTLTSSTVGNGKKEQEISSPVFAKKSSPPSLSPFTSTSIPSSKNNDMVLLASNDTSKSAVTNFTCHNYDNKEESTASIIKIDILDSSVSSSSSSLLSVNKCNPTKHTNDNNTSREQLNISSIINIHEQEENQQKQSKENFFHHHNRFHLCKRWIVSLSTSHKGSTRYHESIQIKSAFITHDNLCLDTARAKEIIATKFKGSNVEGTLDPNLSSILTPLLSYEPGGSLIDVQAIALMEDLNIQQMTEVPLELNVWIVRPLEFFRLFELNEYVSNDKAFTMISRHCNNNSNSNKVNHINKTSCREAAFSLLQWAKYGTTLPVEVTSLKSHNDDVISENSSDKTNTITEKNVVITTDDGYDHENRVQDEKEESQCKTEEASLYGKNSAVQEEEVTHKNESSEEWKESSITEVEDGTFLYTASSFHNNDVSCHIIDKETDLSSVKNSICKREALNWMMRREIDGEHLSNNNENQMKHFDLLSSLVSVNNIGNPGSAARTSVIGSGIEPVEESEEWAARIKPLDDGTNNEDNDNHPRVPNFGNTVIRNHPLWEKRFLRCQKKDSWTTDATTTAEGIRNCDRKYYFYVNELLRTVSKHAPSLPKPCVGGILTDTTGLGKKLLLLSLIAVSKEKDKESIKIQKNWDRRVPNTLKKKEKMIQNLTEDDKFRQNTIHPFTTTTTTLLVVPVSLLSQWEDKIRDRKSLTSFAYSGNPAGNINFSKFDVVITTYGIVQGEYLEKYNNSDKEKDKINNLGLLFSIHWKRVILDDAHLIKNPETVLSKGCCMLSAERRWCITGTLIQNPLQDVFSLMKFLKHEPWCNWAFWKATMINPQKSPNPRPPNYQRPVEELKCVNSSDITVETVVRKKEEDYEANESSLLDKQVDIDRVRRLLAPLMMILTKEKLSFDGKSSQKEQTLEPEILQPLLSRDSSDNGTNKFLYKLLEAFHDEKKNDGDIQKLMTLQPHQLKEQKRTVQRYSDKVAHLLSTAVPSNEALDEECPICLEQPKCSDLAITPCAHIFCRECLLKTLKKSNGTCKKQRNSETVNLLLRSQSSKSYCKDGECPVCMTLFDTSKIIFTSTESTP